MKKFTLIAALLLSFAGVKAQSFTLDHDTTKGYWVSAGYTVDVKNDLHNTGATTSTYSWKMTNYDFPSGWVLEGTCDNNECKATSTPGLKEGTTSFTTLPVNAGSTGNFKIMFNGDAASNNTKATVTLDIANSSGGASKSATFIAYKNPTGIISTTLRHDDEVLIYPNPATNYIDVVYSPSSDVKSITIYNLIGKVVNVYKVTDKNSARCEFNTEMPSGIYFVRVADSKGNVIATRKITHQ